MNEAEKEAEVVFPAEWTCSHTVSLLCSVGHSVTEASRDASGGNKKQLQPVHGRRDRV